MLTLTAVDAKVKRQACSWTNLSGGLGGRHSTMGDQ